MLIAPFPPPERGRARRPSFDDRRVFEGILRVARTGSPWRDLPERLGKSNAVWRRFARRRDAGVFEDLLDALAAGDAAVRMIESAVIRARRHRAGGRKGRTF